jgi:hypothetical protein
MTHLRVAAFVVAAVFVAACGPKPPPVPPAPPPTKASLMAEGKEKVKRVLGYIEEMEQIRGVPKEEGSPIPVDDPPPPKAKKGKAAKAATPAPAAPKSIPRPAGMDEAAVMELDRLLSRARELKDQIVAMREELAESLETAQEPIAGADLAKARSILSRMGDKVGEVRDQRTRALELKPKPPEPEKKKPAPAPAPAPTPAPTPAKK